MENEATLTAASTDTTDTGAETDTVTTSATAITDTAELVDELLIEEISIDGMCGVY